MRPARTGIAASLALCSAAILLALLVNGCASNPAPVTWSAPGVTPKPYRNLVVFGVAANGKVRRAYEVNFVAALRARGVSARAGHGLLPDGGLGDVKAVKRAVAGTGAEGVIITHLVGERSAQVQSRNFVNPSLSGSLYPYYQRVHGYVTEPGYYANFPMLQLETNLYDIARETLVWSARSQPMDPGSEKTTINEVIETMIRSLAEAGFLPKQSERF